MRAALVLSVATAVVLVAAAAGSGPQLMGSVTVTIAASGPTPATAKLIAGLEYVKWKNVDQAAHTVVFVNGRCGLRLAAGQGGHCVDTFWRYVGVYPYTVSDVEHRRGEVIVEPAPRRVTISASPKTVGAGDPVTLRGELSFASYPRRRLGQRVSILARLAGADRFSRVGAAAARSMRLGPRSNTFRWSLVVRPQTATEYKARAAEQPREGTVWVRAESQTVTVRVRR